MSLVDQYRSLFRPTLWLETTWRNFIGRGTKFPTSYGQLVIDHDVRFNDGRTGILLLLIQRASESVPHEALIGTVSKNGGGSEPATSQQRCAVSDVQPVSSHGGRDDEAVPLEP